MDAGHATATAARRAAAPSAARRPINPGLRADPMVEQSLSLARCRELSTVRGTRLRMFLGKRPATATVSRCRYTHLVRPDAQVSWSGRVAAAAVSPVWPSPAEREVAPESPFNVSAQTTCTRVGSDPLAATRRHQPRLRP